MNKNLLAGSTLPPQHSMTQQGNKNETLEGLDFAVIKDYKWTHYDNTIQVMLGKAKGGSFKKKRSL